MADPLPTKVNEHTWTTIKNSSTQHHHLIPLGAGRLLDWVEETGGYNVWVGKDLAVGSTEDPYQDTPQTSGIWQTIKAPHQLVFLANTPGNWFEGNVLDWVPAGALDVRIWKFDRSIAIGDPMPVKLNQSNFSTIGAGHVLIYLDADRVLDWVAATGNARVWQYDRARTNQDPLPTKVTENTWASIRTGHQLVYLGGNLLLDWEESTGHVRVWRYDRTLSGNVDPLPTLDMDSNWTAKIAAGRRLHYLGGDRVLDWDSVTGNERVWDFDRPVMPAAQFQTMLTADIARAAGWVTAAQVRLTAYQAGLLSGIHDAGWNATDAALATHFHAQAHPSGVQAALSSVMTTYGQILARLGVGTTAFQQVAKAQAVIDLGGLNNYTRGYTSQNVFTRLTPAYRPLDTIGELGLDGAGDKLRAAILIHEATHFVGNNPDSALEWDLAAYAALPSAQAITNPASYAAFAHQMSPGGFDLRFGSEPWQ